ncbi:Protein kinase STUNTED [Linum perenne]
MMIGRSSIEHKFLSLLRAKASKQRTIVVGLKSDTHSREMLLRVLHTSANPGDNVLAVHVQEASSSFDPNSFHMHADLSKSKQVDFLVKVCAGESYISGLSDQVRLNSATVLVLGCSLRWPKESVVKALLKSLPPTCRLLVMNSAGKIIFQSQGTSQQGSTSPVLKPSLSDNSYFYQPKVGSPQLQKSPTTPSSSKDMAVDKKTFEVSDFLAKKCFDRLMHLVATGPIRRFTWEELNLATKGFIPELLIGKGGSSKVYHGTLRDGQAVAVKVLKSTDLEDLLREVEILSGLRHENIVQMIGCCDGKGMHAVVYNLLEGSLKRNFKHLSWNERMGVAIGVAKALEYLHHSFTPPIVHRDVKASNILLSENMQPQLSDFGAAIRLDKVDQMSANVKPFEVVGTFGYLAPEYVMYGKVDVKIDVYSYGVVLLELITGKEAIQANQENSESLVLWAVQARSLLSSGLYDRLIDPHLNGDYNKEEMETLVFLSRLCLVHSSSRRPSMKMVNFLLLLILRLFEDPESMRQMLRKKDEFLDASSSEAEMQFASLDDVPDNGMPTTENLYSNILSIESSDS